MADRRSMEHADRQAWAASAATEAFLLAMADRFQPDHRWRAAESWDRVNQLKGQREVLTWVADWISGTAE